MRGEAAYDQISKHYADLVLNDPSKRYVQFPWALDQIDGGPVGKRILDVGCGEGSLLRILARMGASCTGYDISPAQIEHAKRLEANDSLGIDYIVADPEDVLEKMEPRTFDVAVSTAVLHYAADEDHLARFFSSTRALLKPGGLFAALVCNPLFKRFGRRLYNRCYERETEGTLRVDFCDDHGVSCSAHYSDFSVEAYESAAQNADLSSIAWVPVKVTPAGWRAMGDFWDGFEEDCPYVGLRCLRRN